MLGKIEGKSRRGQQSMNWLDSITDSMYTRGQRSLACCSPWGHRVGHDLAAEQQQVTENLSQLSKGTQLIDQGQD